MQLFNKTKSIEGLVVNTVPKEVVKVLAKRPDPIAPHPLDDAQAEMRELLRRKTSVLLSTPAALRATVKDIKEQRQHYSRTSDTGKDLLLLHRNLSALRARMKTEFEVGRTSCGDKSMGTKRSNALGCKPSSLQRI